VQQRHARRGAGLHRRRLGAADNPWTVATDVTIDGSPTFEKIKSSGTVTVGVKEDQPGLGYLDPVTNTRSGFDVDIARWIAASLGVRRGQDPVPADRLGQPRAGHRER
jgi:ABC-type amino acid transport substrate-binding protein